MTSLAQAEPLRPVPLLQQRPFRMLSLTRFESRVAQNALNFGLVLLIVDATGKALFSSILVLALVIPSTVFGIAAGTAADILPKRALIVAGNLGRAVVCLFFVGASGNTATYYIVAIALATAGQFATSAEGATLPAIVQHSELTQANAIGQAIGGGAQLVGLAILTPVVLRLFHSPTVLFLSCGALFTLAAFHALFIGNTKSPSARKEVGGEWDGPWWKTGWQQMRSDPAVMHSAMELTLISAALIILAGLIPKYIEDTLGLPVDVGAAVLMPAAMASSPAFAWRASWLLASLTRSLGHVRVRRLCDKPRPRRLREPGGELSQRLWRLFLAEPHQYWKFRPGWRGSDGAHASPGLFVRHRYRRGTDGAQCARAAPPPGPCARYAGCDVGRRLLGTRAHGRCAR